jgi:hypothetical protein
MAKFRVVMKEPLRIPENPFRPGLINECVRRREAILEDADEESVRQHFAEAKAQNGEATAPTTEAAEIDRLTSELKAVQERAASEISELAVAVTDLKFELHNARVEIARLARLVQIHA